MSLVVGTDTYISLADAEAYVSKHYISTDPLRVTWDALSDDDKEVYIRNATASIDALALSGRKKDITQVLQFPRCYDTKRYVGVGDIDEYNYSGRYYSQPDVPEDVKQAQVEVAVFNCDKKANERLILQTQGVESFSIGDLSESYSSAKSAYSIESILKSEKAIKLMRSYLGGTYNVV